MAVYILGGSVTGGGGVHDNATNAWPARIHARYTVHFKNAIEPSYFLHCSDRFVADAPPYEAVILDFGPNLWSREAPQYLASLVHVARSMTNASRAGLVAWPRLGNRNDVSLVKDAARRSGAVAILPLRGLEKHLYADAVHPNAQGHARIAKHVDRFLSTPLTLSTPLMRTRTAVSVTRLAETCYWIISLARFPHTVTLPVNHFFPFHNRVHTLPNLQILQISNSP